MPSGSNSNAVQYKNNDIDTDGDGKVNNAVNADNATQADNATKVKGNDIDTDGDGRVDKADDAVTLQGNQPSDLGQIKEFTDEDIADFMLDTVARQGEQDFEIGLTQTEADSGFYDNHVDSLKIVSKTNVFITTGTNGKISLKGTGNISRPSDGSFNQLSGSRGLKIEANNDISKLEVELSSKTDNVSEVGITDNSGNKIDSKTGSFTSGDVIELSASLTSNNIYRIYCYNGGSNFNAGYNSSTTLPITSEFIDIIEGSITALSSPSGSSALYSIKNVTATKISDSGTVTYTKKNLTDDQGNSFSPSKVRVDPDYVLNSQSLEYDVLDGNGTVLTSFTESELGSFKNVDTTSTEIQLKAKPSGDGTDTPIIESSKIFARK